MLNLALGVTSDTDLSRGRVAGSGSTPWQCIQFRLTVTERDSAERLWALCSRGLTTDCNTCSAYLQLMLSQFQTTYIRGFKVWGVITQGKWKGILNILKYFSWHCELGMKLWRRSYSLHIIRRSTHKRQCACNGEHFPANKNSCMVFTEGLKGAFKFTWKKQKNRWCHQVYHDLCRTSWQ